jgi:hypothetical protein
MTSQTLNALLAERVMKWSAAPNRFLLGGRKWIPSWRFRPFENLADSFRLLDAAGSTVYTLNADETGCFIARVQIGTVVGEACDRSLPSAITIAVARATGIEVDDVG